MRDSDVCHDVYALDSQSKYSFLFQRDDYDRFSSVYVERFPSVQTARVVLSQDGERIITAPETR